MIDPQIAADIELTHSHDRLSISAYVRGAPDQPLRWRLEAITRTSGGSSSVTQSGTVDAERLDPVSTMAVNAGSEGRAVLVVFAGEREVARDEVVLSANGDAQP